MTARKAAAGRPSPIARLRARLKGRPDGEHEIVLNRLVISTLLLIYLALSSYVGDHGLGPEFQTAMLFAAGGWLFAAHLLWRPGASRIRRSLAMIVDLAALSIGMHLGGEVTAILYPAYLWIIFGNGFRFGVPALFTGAAIGIAGFAAVIATTDYWASNIRLSCGLLVGLLVLPAYAATLIKKLERARLAAEEASRAKSLFLASVSHELRTPLNAVIGMTDLLDQTKLDAEQREMARTAGTAGRALLAQIDDVLNFSRLDAGKMPVVQDDFDLHELLAAARGMLTAQARAKTLRLRLHVTPRTPYALRGDARHIRDVLVNLLGNAVKFTQSGGVAVAVDMVGGTAAAPRLRFEVSDTGIGIAPEARARIFDSFTQADETIINSHGGTGLGLAICRQLIELNGGEIGVESEAGVGSTFWFELDLAASESRFQPLAPDVQIIAVAPSRPRADALVAAFASVGRSVEPVPDLRSAMRVLAEPSVSGRRAAIVDVRGSDVDGEGLARALRAADDAGSLEIALIDPTAPAGLPPVGLRHVCAAVAADPTGPEILAMTRAASVGAVRRAVVADAPADAFAVVGRRLSILVAEDNRTNQKVITKILERAGHEVSIAENGEIALDALNERVFDMVLMDINMPLLDGVECTKLYRFASIGKPRFPIVALTADATPDARERCLEAGMDACLTKPIEPRQLLAIIAEICAQGPAAPTAAAELAASPVVAAAEETVADITRHPNYRSAKRPVVDREILDELESLGGRTFVADLVGEFIVDAAAVIRSLGEAVAAREASAFREQAHALRSGAANIGARGMYEICLSYRNADAQDLAANGAEHLKRLENEFARVRKTLRQRFPEQPDAREKP